MKAKILSALRYITKSPGINVSVGFIFLATGLVEIINSIGEMSVGAHHGAVLFGFFHILKYLPDLVEGMEYVQKINRD